MLQLNFINLHHIFYFKIIEIESICAHIHLFELLVEDLIKTRPSQVDESSVVQGIRRPFGGGIDGANWSNECETPGGEHRAQQTALAEMLDLEHIVGTPVDKLVAAQPAQERAVASVVPHAQIDLVGHLDENQRLTLASNARLEEMSG